MAQDDDPRAPYKVFEGDELKGVDAHVAANGPAQFLQPLQECRDTDLIFRIVRRAGDFRSGLCRLRVIHVVLAMCELGQLMPQERRQSGHDRCSELISQSSG
jgi:hypothetical protein